MLTTGRIGIQVKSEPSCIEIDIHRRQIILIVCGVTDKARADLAQIADALDRLCLVPGRIQRGQQHSRQDRDDGDHDKELYERKTVLPLKWCASSF